MQLIDTHAHLTHGKLRQQVVDVLARARQGGVAAVICAAGDLHESKAALGLAGREDSEPPVFCTAGVHPHDAKNATERYLSQLEELLAQPRCVALGEIGLDFHYDFSPREVQRLVFVEQLDLARRLTCPVVVHTREAFDDTMTLLRDSGVSGERVVFHSFTGGAPEAEKALDFGATLSFSGISTFQNAAGVRAAAALAPAGRILIETDAPYLSPEPVRSMKINEPANLVHVARALAAQRGLAVEAFAEQTTANAVRVFGLDIG